MAEEPSRYASGWDEVPAVPLTSLNTYLVLLPDLAEGSARVPKKELHFAGSVAGHTNGWIVGAGPTFVPETSPPPPGGGSTEPKRPRQITGSWYIVRGASQEEAWKRISRDVYAGTAWDMEKATITPVAVAKNSEELCYWD